MGVDLDALSSEVVTIPEANVTIIDPATKHELLAKDLSCTCGWTRREMVVRCEQQAINHLRYTHGRGRYIYLGHEQSI